MKNVWLITGAGRGLGRAFVEAAVKNGDSVIAGVRRIDPEDALFREPEVLVVKLDVTDQTQIDAAVQAGMDRFGRIDILVNNAGFGMNGALEEISEAELQHLFATDYFGLINMTKAVLPVMRAQKSGKILNVASEAGIVAGAGCTAYNAVKFAVVGLSHGLREELACFGIQVCVVCPGPFRTDFRDGSSMPAVAAPMPEYDGTPAHNIVAWLKENNHMQDGDPQKAAALVVRIASQDTIPRTLALGKGCCDHIRDNYARTLEEMETYYEDSAATAFAE